MLKGGKSEILICQRKMKHRINRLLLIMVVAVCNIAFTGCSSDSDGYENIGSSELIGILKSNKWITRDASFGEGDNNHAWLDVESTTLYFTSDDKGFVYWTQKDYDTDLGNSRTNDYSPFTYTASGNKITITNDNGYTNNLVYSGKYLVEGSSIYDKYPMSSGDYDLLQKISPKSGKCGSGLTYIYYPKTHCLKISGNGDMDDYSSTNQPWHGYYIEQVEIENGCTSVGANAFRDKLQISEISLPSTLKKIGNNAFAGTLITYMNIPNNVEVIGDGAFSGCSYLKTVLLSDNLKTIGKSAFSGCKISNSYFSMPANVTSVGDYAFSGWEVGNMTLNDKLETIGHGAFSGVKGTINIPNSVKSIGALAFEGSFTKVVIGTGLKKMTSTAFAPRGAGSFYVNLGVPIDLDGIYSVFAEDNIQARWTLYVPKGAKNAYSKKSCWKGFKEIIEDASLVSGNGMPENDEQNNGNSTSNEGKINGYDYVDLGLSVKWATCNVGAKKPEENGNYYCYGRIFEETDTPSSTQNICGNGDYDVARYRWGDTWRTPNYKEFQELVENCPFSVGKSNGVSVIIAKSKKDKKSICFPFSGYKRAFKNYNHPTFDYKYKGKSVYCMIGEIYDNDIYSGKNHYFECWDAKDVTCSGWFNLTFVSIGDEYKLPVRPVSK